MQVFWNQLTDSSRAVLLLALEETKQCGHAYVGLEHILLAILKQRPRTIPALVLADSGVTYESFARELHKAIGIHLDKMDQYLTSLGLP